MADFPKHAPPRISIQTRLGHANRMANIVDRFAREQAAKGIIRDAEAAELTRYTNDVIGTFRWLIDEEAGIRVWLMIPEADRRAIAAAPAVAAEAARKAMEVSDA